MPKLTSRERPLDPVYIGIDPGMSNGGIAWISPDDGLRTIQAMNMPLTDRDIWEAINLTGLHNLPRVAVIEWVNPAYKQTAKSANSKLYGNFMSCRMALTAAGISFDIVMPAKWQQGLKIPPGGKDKNQTQWKNFLKGHAQRMFPQTKLTLHTCDAALIAEYCRRFHKGMLK